MMNDPYSQMTNEDHNDLCAWLDDLGADGGGWGSNPDMISMRGPLPHDDEGVRCGCEDYPCCGH